MQEKAKPLLIIIAGPTAVGKTSVALQLATDLSTAIINCDSRQVYREMVIGTAMPGAAEQSKVPHYFFGHRSIHNTYNASIYEEEVISFLEGWFKKHRSIIMTGGSGLYIDAVCKGIDDLPSVDAETRYRLKEEYDRLGHDAMLNRLKITDPEYYAVVDPDNSRRILKALEIYDITGRKYSSFLTRIPKKRDFNIKITGLDRLRNELHDRINKRTDDMMEHGLENEARLLMPYRHLNALNTVGYKELFGYFDGKYSLGEAIEKIKAHTRQYARRQLTWFRRYRDIQWFHPDDYELIRNNIRNMLDFRF